MPVGYLINIALVGAFTAVALAPPSRPRPVAQIAYLLGMVVTEVPHLAAGLPLAMATALALAGGDLERDGESLALLGAAGVVGVGLAVVAARGIRARDAIAVELRRAGIAVPQTPRGWAWRTALSPLPVRPGGSLGSPICATATTGANGSTCITAATCRPEGRSWSTCTAAATTPAASTTRGGRCCTGWPPKDGSV